MSGSVTEGVRLLVDAGRVGSVLVEVRIDLEERFKAPQASSSMAVSRTGRATDGNESLLVYLRYSRGSCARVVGMEGVEVLHCERSVGM